MSTPDTGSTTDQPTAYEVAADAQLESMLSKVGHAWWLIALLGLISIIVGILVLIRPFEAVRIAAIIFGIWLLVSGILQLVQSFDNKLDATSRILSVISGLLGIVLGVICFNSVQDRISLLILFIGLWWIIRGVMQLVTGASGASGAGSSGMFIFTGILGILAGIVVLTWPITSLEILTVMVGIWLIVLGVFEVVVSIRVRSIDKKLVAQA